MERFNYIEWKKNPQRKVVNLRGNDVTNIEYFKSRNKYCIGAKVCDIQLFFTIYGEYMEQNVTDMDLFFADDDRPENTQPKTNTGLHWRKCKAGYKFPSDAIVIPDDERTTDRDPRLVRCAVWDSKYILIDDLKKLPVENG